MGKVTENSAADKKKRRKPSLKTSIKSAPTRGHSIWVKCECHKADNANFWARLAGGV